MSEPTPTPTTDPTPAAQQQAPEANAAPQGGPAPSGPRGPGPRPGGYQGQGGPPRPGNQGEPRGRDRFPRGDRPRTDGTKPPDLGFQPFTALRPNRRALDQSIEDELNAALAGFDVTGTVAPPEGKAKRQPGVQPKKRGTIVGIHGKDVFVDVPGGRSQGFLPLEQFEGNPPRVGDSVEFDIEGYDAANGLLKLTMTGAAAVVTDWSSVSVGMVVEAKVTGVNKNKTGLLIEVNGIKGFLPISQISMYRVEDTDEYLNQKLKVEVVELDAAERNLVVSRRIMLERERARMAEQFWAEIEEGQVREGIVRSVKPFGAFVDLGAADGLIPISELSWSRVGDASEVVSIGQKVQVVVHRLDRDARKVTLSLRGTIRSPWDDFAEQNKAGARLTGKVTRMAEFGAFVEVSPGVEGLVHVSELSTQRVRRPQDVLKEGQTVEVQLLSVDPHARRMSLSLKSLMTEAEAAEHAKQSAEDEAGRKESEERMANRKANPNLRGGIGGGKLWWEKDE